MSGGSLPYHLRLNKSVDRRVFIELLTMLDNCFISIKNSQYISFGGPMLEDFKVMHDHFRTTDFVSLESDPEVYRRQKFNKPFSCVKLTDRSSREFIDGYPGKKNIICWLDYASSKEHGQQFQEFYDLLSKLSPNDVIKITLNAELESFLKVEQYDSSAREKIFNILKERIDEHLDPNLTHDDMTEKRLPEILLDALGVTAGKALRGSRYVFKPILNISYKDSHRMLTVTGILLNKKDEKSFLQKTGIGKWPFYTADWSALLEIALPNLTIREKHFIDRLLPRSDFQGVRKQLKFLLDSEKELSNKKLQSYIEFYRFYPNFAKVLA